MWMLRRERRTALEIGSDQLFGGQDLNLQPVGYESQAPVKRSVSETSDKGKSQVTR